MEVGQGTPPRSSVTGVVLIISGADRWSTKYPLHVSSSPPPANEPSFRPSSHARRASTYSSTRARTTSLSASLADSQIEADVAELAAPGGAFTMALAMLVYDVCFLAHTQAVDVPLAQAGEVLCNLWAVCCSPELGRCVPSATRLARRG